MFRLPGISALSWILSDGVLKSEVCENIKDKPEEERIVIVKSWNEWGEGNYLEPDLKYGRQFLETLKRTIDDFFNEERHE